MGGVISGAVDGVEQIFRPNETSLQIATLQSGRGKYLLVLLNKYLLTALNKYLDQMEQVCRGVEGKYRFQTSSIWRQLLPDRGVAQQHALPAKSSKHILFFTDEFTQFEMLNESNF